MPMLRDGSATADPRLDRMIQFDERSRAFGISEVLDTSAALVTKLWAIPSKGDQTNLDQGQEGACTGFGTTNELRFSPIPVIRADGRGLDYTFAREYVYWEAQKIDPWPGGAYPGALPRYEGTSVLAAVKRMQTLGFYTEYRWAFGEQDLARSIGTIGPAILGLNWYQGMYKPNSRGYLRPTGAVQGGHCLLCIGYDARYKYYTLYNSWGPKWGKNGTARVSAADMTTLLANNGEACIVTGRSVPAGYTVVPA